MSVSRLAVAVSLLFSYPLVFNGLRGGVLDIVQVPMDERTDGTLNAYTIGILSMITSLAFVVSMCVFVW
jgi:hypothetical protein